MLHFQFDANTKINYFFFLCLLIHNCFFFSPRFWQRSSPWSSKRKTANCIPLFFFCNSQMGVKELEIQCEHLSFVQTSVSSSCFLSEMWLVVLKVTHFKLSDTSSCGGDGGCVGSTHPTNGLTGVIPHDVEASHEVQNIAVPPWSSYCCSYDFHYDWIASFIHYSWFCL